MKTGTPQPDAAQIEGLFTDADAGFRFARWGRPIVPVIFGAAEDSLPALKGAIEAVVLAAGHHMAEADPDIGANLMIFFLRDWDELSGVQNMDQLVPDLAGLLPRLASSGADQYRFFRFDQTGAIKAGFVFLRMTGPLAEMPAADLGMEQAVKSMLLWSPQAFAERSPLARIDTTGATVLRADIAALLMAAYDPILPAASGDAVLSLRLAARAGQLMA
ncbi:hypothetical protein DL237_04800 [Pseudooceanicola sediminis]|uniref:Uncharacterized protein n=1 Tax=Pseudooceanicola sediminis TaxID=2211117 RepID=A0A399J4B8_9RHOB|nr:hypothetical protein E0K93_10755 [Puniceibacterium sp. HSS470]RII40100.1 hypothetical protein DL237_04800 [Pseudooceanicola sediminis]